MKPKSSSPNVVLTLLAAGAVFAATAAGADTGTVTASPKSVAGSGAARFDWLANRNVRPAPLPVAQQPALGTGSWICTPAGFNRKSSCFAR